MRIAFITDLHIGAEDEKPLGVDVRQNLLNALAFLPEIDPDCLIIGGDICYQTGDRAIYQWVNQQLQSLSIPCYVIPGNHDDPVLLAEEMNLTHHLEEGNEVYYALPLEGYPALFLDTAKGTMSPKQWTWLREHLRALNDNNVIIFMHHPPIPADVKHMDINYPFRQSDKFINLVKELPCHVITVSGHYHVEKVVQRGNLLALLTPSLFFQMKHDPAEVVNDHYRIGIREINLTSHGMNSTVHYL